MKPCLVIMAAGLGSRYGGMKQIDPVDADGCAIIDYSIFDAHRAGFEKVILVIKREHEEAFRDTVLRRVGGKVCIEFAYQGLEPIASDIAIPEGRQKPWGTAHAVLCAKPHVEGAFAAINADDFYGYSAFRQIHDFLAADHGEAAHAMIGFRIKNTVTENGFVSRGVCRVDGSGFLREIIERTHIAYHDGGIAFTEDAGETWTTLEPDTLVSMSIWGFGASMMGEIERRIAPFFRENLPSNPLKTEFFLPYVPDQLIKESVGSVKVLPNEEKWYGVTYAEDMPAVRRAIADLKASGSYPARLWR